MALFVWRTERTVLAIAERWLSSREKSVDADVTLKSVGKLVPPIPQDLQALAHRESEPWAIEQVEASLRDCYAEHGDWDMVRNQVLQ